MDCVQAVTKINSEKSQFCELSYNCNCSSCMIFEVPFLLNSVSSSSNYLQFSYFFFPDSTRDLRVPDYTRDIQSLCNTFETAMDFCSSSTFLVYVLTLEQKLSAHSHPRIAYTVDMSVTVFCTVYGRSFHMHPVALPAHLTSIIGFLE